MVSPTTKLAGKLSVFAGAMFLFCLYVMPPLYNLLCEVTGLRKTNVAYQAVEAKVDTSRTVTVQFIATQNKEIPWDFKPMAYKVKVHPGEKKVIKYFARNNTANDMVGQAVPSITPFNAVNYFHKIECFCFNSQPLKGGESAELALEFTIDQELPPQVTTITLAYTLFDVTAATSASAALSP